MIVGVTFNGDRTDGESNKSLKLKNNGQEINSNILDKL